MLAFQEVSDTRTYFQCKDFISINTPPTEPVGKSYTHCAIKTDIKFVILLMLPISSIAVTNRIYTCRIKYIALTINFF